MINKSQGLVWIFEEDSTRFDEQKEKKEKKNG